MSRYAQDLKRMQGTMQKEMKTYDPNAAKGIESGEYTFQIKAGLTRSQKTKKLMIAWVFTVVDEGANHGRKTYDNSVLEGDTPGSVNTTGANIARGRIEDLGYTWPEENLAELETILDQINANPPRVLARATVKDRDDGSGRTNTRIFFLEVLDTASGATDGAQGAAEDAGQGSGSPSDDQGTTGTDDHETALLNICISFGTPGITQGMGLKAMVKAILAGTERFPEESLQPEELATLEAIEPKLIQRKVPERPKRTMAKVAGKRK